MTSRRKSNYGDIHIKFNVSSKMKKTLSKSASGNKILDIYHETSTLIKEEHATRVADILLRFCDVIISKDLTNFTAKVRAPFNHTPFYVETAATKEKKEEPKVPAIVISFSKVCDFLTPYISFEVYDLDKVYGKNAQEIFCKLVAEISRDFSTRCEFRAATSKNKILRKIEKSLIKCTKSMNKKMLLQQQ